MPGEDELIKKGFSVEEAQNTTEAFEKYIDEHRDEIEALRIIYNNKGESITYNMLKELEEKLIAADRHFKLPLLWSNYSVIAPDKVLKLKNQEERAALTNLIQLVRYAYKIREKLYTITSETSRRYGLWCGHYGQNYGELSDKQKEIMKKIAGYISTNGAYTRTDIAEQDQPLLIQTIKSFGSKVVVDDVLVSLSKFILAA